MKSSLLSLFLKIRILISITSVIVLSLILTTSRMTILVLPKVLNFLCLLDHKQNIILKHVLLIHFRYCSPNHTSSTSNISLQTITSASNVLVNTQNIGTPPPPKLDPPLPPILPNPLITQPSTSQSPHQYNVPSHSPHNQIPLLYNQLLLNIIQIFLQFPLIFVM